jgi:predicted esterase
MKKMIGIILVLQFLICFLRAEQVEVEVIQHSFNPPLNMTRADVYSVKTSYRPKAVLVLCPGCNGSAEGTIAEKPWRDFAAENGIGLSGIAFSSDQSLFEAKRSYQFASEGSGQVLIDALHKIYEEDLPVFIYGFSAGAQFAARFTEWKPERVKGWCAYAAGSWDEPQADRKFPPGIIATGEEDKDHLAWAMLHYRKRRELGMKLFLVRVPHNGHTIDSRVDTLVRNYFACLLEDTLPLEENASELEDSSISTGKEAGIWFDLENKEEVSKGKAKRIFEKTGWLPDRKLIPLWEKIREN